MLFQRSNCNDGMIVFTVIGICTGFSDFKLIDAGQRELSIVMKAFECDMWIAVI